MTVLDQQQVQQRLCSVHDWELEKYLLLRCKAVSSKQQDMAPASGFHDKRVGVLLSRT
jgi:hypothetical protein